MGFPAKIGPQPVMPVTDGAPVMGIPLGGDMYLPVTGGPRVVGIPSPLSLESASIEPGELYAL